MRTGALPQRVTGALTRCCAVLTTMISRAVSAFANRPVRTTAPGVVTFRCEEDRFRRLCYEHVSELLAQIDPLPMAPFPIVNLFGIGKRSCAARVPRFSIVPH
jgi:hypothetical protein